MNYPANVREFARRMHAAGYSAYRIQKALRSRGYPVSEDGVRCWVDPEYAEARAMRRRTGRKPGRAARRGWQRRHDRMEELRGLGLSYRSIAAVMTNDFEDLDLSENQVRAIFRGWVSDGHVRSLLWPADAAGSKRKGRPPAHQAVAT